MSNTITISSTTIAEQLNEWQLCSYDLKDGGASLAIPSPRVPVHGVFREDPTWDGFQQSIGEYNDYINALERGQE